MKKAWIWGAVLLATAACSPEANETTDRTEGLERSIE